jgi:hypothetical protein
MQKLVLKKWKLKCEYVLEFIYVSLIGWDSLLAQNLLLALLLYSEEYTYKKHMNHMKQDLSNSRAEQQQLQKQEG